MDGERKVNFYGLEKEKLTLKYIQLYEILEGIEVKFYIERRVILEFREINTHIKGNQKGKNKMKKSNGDALTHICRRL